MSKKTVVFGASTNPSRYAYMAANKLHNYNHEIVPLGIKKGEVAGADILDLRTRPVIDHVHTVTMYMSAQNQSEWEDYILSIKPKRIIFNPGAENPSLQQKANEQNIETLEACTLVMLSANQY